MNWTKTPPTKPGVYLLKKAFSGDDMVAQVFEDGQCQIIGYPWGRNVSDWGGEWCGPLVPAEEVERAYREGHMEGRCGALPMAEVANEDYARSRARRVVEGEEV